VGQPEDPVEGLQAGDIAFRDFAIRVGVDDEVGRLGPQPAIRRRRAFRIQSARES
jgi:hypothetical protein